MLDLLFVDNFCFVLEIFNKRKR